MNKKRSFTLIELMIVVIVLGILATLVIPAYTNIMEESKAKVCATNLAALQSSLEIYVRENDSIPGALSEIPQAYLNRGYAKVMGNKKDKWRIDLAYLSLGLLDRGYAHAQSLRMMDLARGNRNLLVCPSDKRNIANKISYAFNNSIRNMTKGQLFLSGEISIGEFDVPANSPAVAAITTGTIARRHKKGVDTQGYGQVAFGCGAGGVKDKITCINNCNYAYCKCAQASCNVTSCSGSSCSACSALGPGLSSRCQINCKTLFN